MRRSCRSALLCLTLAALASAASAGNPFYVTGKLGDTSLDADLGASVTRIIDGDDTSWGLGIGFRLGRYMAFQAEYHDLGSASGEGSPCPVGEVCILIVVPVAADSTAISVTFLPHLPLGERFYLYGKVGFVSWESDLSEIQDVGERFIDDPQDEDLVFGAGFRFMLPGPFGLFVEYERIADTFETVSLGATYGF